MPGAVQWALGDQGLGALGLHDAPEGCLSPASSPPSPGPSSSPFGPRVRGSGKVYISSMFGVWEFRKVKAALFLLRQRHCIHHGASEFVAVPHSALKGCLLPRTSTLIWPSSHDGIMQDLTLWLQRYEALGCPALMSQPPEQTSAVDFERLP